ncbi:hypothetical protein RWH43_17110 [Microbacterium sp. KSW2-21]|uniref:DUF8175 domain-containing protein n=1 Tax=Microbacterium algihabitans TaxID=3075992 RepID=A0ABU3S019_9MICO|nr:hypothetical protein [Microbacterium sp. KSW2-21]MDU0328481.1 hypothetical protein [Microbacterium sp. KSW2-21]
MADDDDTTQNPFSRPGFIVGAVVVAALIITAVFLTVLNLNRDSDTAPPAADATSNGSASSAPTLSASGAAGGASVCGLSGVELTGTVSTAPVAEWQYQDVDAYPVSPSAGPGETAPERYRYCYQHTPEGAVFAAANMTIAGFGPVELRSALLDYALTDGQYRERLLESSGGSSSSDVRAAIAGFRVLEYTGDTARIDIAFRGTASGQAVTGSTVYELIWEGGDWRIDANKAEPARIAQLPDLSGYTSWTVG